MNHHRDPFRNDAFKAFAGLTDLTTLDLAGAAIHDRHLPPLEAASVRQLDLRRTYVTAAGVKRLAATLPKCRIEWNGGVIEPK